VEFAKKIYAVYVTYSTKRPEYSKLFSAKVEKLLGEKIPTWQSGIDRLLEEMKENGELE
jgi:dTDP-4-dehydrorhamnose reductase